MKAQQAKELKGVTSMSLCDKNCNRCPLVTHPNSQLLTVIFNELYNELGETVNQVLQHYCSNLTVCYDCRVDDFCHFEDCKLVDMASVTPEKEIEQAKEYLVRLLKAVYPDIDPLDSLYGLISQVDNGFAVLLSNAQQNTDLWQAIKNIRPISIIAGGATSAVTIENPDWTGTHSKEPYTLTQ